MVNPGSKLLEDGEAGMGSAGRLGVGHLRATCLV